MGGSEGKIRTVKILIDTNIIVDVALLQEPFFEDSDRILTYSEQRIFNSYISGSTFSDLYYILRKSRGKNWTLIFLRRLVLEFRLISTSSRKSPAS